MITKAANLDKTGMDKLQSLASIPDIYEVHTECDDQLYIPGISVPDNNMLNKPFSVPILGDNESVSLAIDWPVKGDAPIYKRISLTGMLVAEDIIRGEPLPDDAAPDEMEAFMDKFEPLNEAFDEFTGDWGGFLYAAIELRGEEVTQDPHGRAEFVIFETKDEFDLAHSLLQTGSISAAEIVSFTRYPRLASQLGTKAINS